MVSMIVISFLVQISGFNEFSNVIIGVLVMLYGVYMLVSLKFRFIHVYCGLQSAYHQKMTPYKPFEFTQEMKRDLKYIGIFFIIAGVVLLAL
jgi:hypothetical protein